MEQKKPLEGTDIVVDPVPDSVLHPEQSYDSDFGELATPPAEESIEEVTAEKKPDDKTVYEPVKQSESVKSEDIDTESITKVSEFETRISALDTENTQLKQDIAKYENVKTTLDELNKQPHVFIRKYFPQLADQINPERIIKQKLAGEFGAEFTYEPYEAYTEGTKSYQYRLRYDEEKDLLSREAYQQQLNQAEVRRKAEAVFNQGKTEAMKIFKLDETKFKELEQWASETVMTPLHWARIKYQDQLIKSAVDAALAKAKVNGKQKELPEQSVAGVHGDDRETGVSEQFKELQDVFGDL